MNALTKLPPFKPSLAAYAVQIALDIVRLQ